MPERFEYKALRAIRQPGTVLTPYHEGDGVPAGAVDGWGLVVGEDVVPTDTKVVPYPDEDAPREQWEAFAVGQGLSPDEAREASLKDLRKIPAPDPEQPAEPLPDPNAPPERPDEDALKVDWIRYVVAQGADEEWANSRSTTKADLMDWEPQPTDEVAAAANETNADE